MNYWNDDIETADLSLTLKGEGNPFLNSDFHEIQRYSFSQWER
jgi:hypothetical protein